MKKLQESTINGLCRIEVMIKTSGKVNKIDVYDEIRALKGVVVCTIEQNEFLDNKSTDEFEYSLLHLKYALVGSPEDTIKNIRKDGLVTNRVTGLLQFIPRFQTIEVI